MMIITIFILRQNLLDIYCLALYNTMLCIEEKNSRFDYSSKAIGDKNVFNIDLKISMLCESRML